MTHEWYLEFLGKPWRGVPNPPLSFNCGELIRYIYRTFFDVSLVPIPIPDACNLRDVISVMVPGYFGFDDLGCNRPKDFDCVFMSRRHIMDHCGMVVTTSEGIQILHCASPCGVVINTPLELKEEYGYSRLQYYRHPEVRSKCQK